MTKPKFPIPEGMEICTVPPKVSPPKGIGRPKGAQNKRTRGIMDAMQSVFEMLQKDSGGENKHLLAWGKANPGQFYRLWMRLLPHQTEGNGSVIATVVYSRAYV
jgi:hypothetical protein